MKRFVNPIQPQALFATPSSVEDLHDIIKGLPKAQHAAAWTLMCMTINYCHGIVGNYIDITSADTMTLDEMLDTVPGDPM